MAEADERMISLKIAEDRRFNPRSHRYEVMDIRQHHFMVPAGIDVDNEFKSSLKGLFAIGDSAAGVHNFCNASTSGFLIGEEASAIMIFLCFLAKKLCAKPNYQANLCVFASLGEDF